MAKNKGDSLRVVGHWAFVVGAVVAVIAGIASGYVAQYAGEITLALVVLGLVVGLLNIEEKETTPFLVAAIALAVAGTSNLQVVNNIIPTLGTILQSVFGNVAAFVAPAALVVALKSVLALGPNK